MGNQYLESVVNELSAQVTRQKQQIDELQEQLTDMQAAMSCDLSVANTRVLQVQSVIEANERAFAKVVKEVLAKDFATSGTLKKLLA